MDYNITKTRMVSKAISQISLKPTRDTAIADTKYDLNNRATNLNT